VVIGMNRRVVVLILLALALGAIAAPAIVAALAIARGEPDEALAVFGPVLLIPVAFIVVGLLWSVRRD
jgi:hypothetical protein